MADKVIENGYTATKEVKPNEYKAVCIKQNDWEQDGTTFVATVEVIGISQNCICYGTPDEEKMLEEAESKSFVYKIINDIFEKQLLEINTKIGKVICRWIGDKPTEKIYLDLTEYPFPDAPTI